MSEILFVAHRCPYPPDRGDRMRSWNVLRYLAARAPVHLVAFSESRQIPMPLAELCASVTLLPHRPRRWMALAHSLWTGRPASLSYFGDRATTQAVQTCLAQAPISKIYAFSGQMAQHVPPVLPSVRFIMDFVDVDSAKFAELADVHRGIRRWVYRREARLLAGFEQSVAHRANDCLFVSGPEAVLFQRRMTNGANVRIVPNGIDSQSYAPALPSARDDGASPILVFTGQMDYAPNVDAVCWMAEHILPRVHRARPDVRFVIVGRNPAGRVRALARKPGIQVTGAVSDPRIWLNQADLVVAPMRLGRGVQNKVLEAMAMGRPVVATPLAADGIDIQPGLEFVRAAGVDAFVRAVLDLLADPSRAAQIGAQARQAMVDRYGWDRCLAPLGALIAS